MKTALVVRTLGICAALSLSAGCGESQLPLGTPNAQARMQVTVSRTVQPYFKVLHNFSGSDGAAPHSNLIEVGGILYGTTYAGGDQSAACRYAQPAHCGTVFSITLRGAETVMHSFGAAKDGSQPTAGLVDIAGTLYGTTTNGGSHACATKFPYGFCGTVFSITSSGVEKVLHVFDKKNDGSAPTASLIVLKDTLYGTTAFSGNGFYYNPGGTVFRITPSGRETVLHNFAGGADGKGPDAALLAVHGKLYSTTVLGGVYSTSRNGNSGTVYSITPQGTETVLHSFGGDADGALPAASLILVNGTLYGTTQYGGASGNGTVFSITTGGTERVLHSFGGSPDGATPVASLIAVNGTLYGTTQYGGASDNGTVFSITPHSIHRRASRVQWHE